MLRTRDGTAHGFGVAGKVRYIWCSPVQFFYGVMRCAQLPASRTPSISWASLPLAHRNGDRRISV